MAHRLLHLSDTHLLHPAVDAAAALDRILFDVRHVPAIDAVVVSGDLADDGSAEGCGILLRKVGDFARERGIPHLYCTGNHDSRDAFRAVFGSGHRDFNGDDIGRTGPDCAAVSEVAGLRVITLDSLVPGEVHGRVSDDQLEWLRALLAEPAPAGSVVVLHHPPIAPQWSEWMQTINLRDADRLAEVIAGRDVQAVLCGHFHLQLSGVLRGVPVWAGPGVVSRLDLTAPPHLMRVVQGAGATIVDLGGPSSPMFHAVHARDPLAGTAIALVDGRTGIPATEQVTP
ncbi:metallophosphoesterase [Actinoplanes derwentensis]|uniref:Calcineurin-like phosphoesterase n=1 Tax=Actinoplanes derwentensis TaxID=113562 RepID=A0A1H1WZ64_9ACTN|nr:metallophosphoesterase [Actinoplanes derwentensis]GID85772.1 phosphohydrolase [Actinoplanes derwentensis]SDT02417.1 Calcineurin-like phosphoesterase [Actinoplanes derwentensis]